MTSPKLPGLVKIDLEVGGVPVRLGETLDSIEWRKACDVVGFSRVWFLGKLALGGGSAPGAAYATKNHALGMFGGKVFAAPDLVGGPMKFSTSASAFFRNGALYRLTAGVAGDKKTASHFAKQCRHTLVSMLGEPSQLTKQGAPVWWGNADRLTLLHAGNAYLIHELTLAESTRP